MGIKLEMNIKKILSFIIIAAMLAASVLSLSSCDKPDIYELIENILQNKNKKLYSFDADLNIKINKEYLTEAMPGELAFKIDGGVYQNLFMIKLTLIDPDGETPDLTARIFRIENDLYVEANDFSRIILDLLYSTGFIGEPVKILFNSLVGYDNGSVICFDLTGFDLKMFDKYISYIEKVFTVKSSVKYDFSIKSYDIVPNFEKYISGKPVLYFKDIKAKINKELLKYPGYRYSELYAVLETDENKNNFMHILATRENGETEILEKFKLDCDLKKVRDNPELVYTENIIPMRYILELLGEDVGWDSVNKHAYIFKNGEYIYFDGSLIKSKTYTSILQVSGKAGFILNSVTADEYIEFKLIRK